MEIFLNKTIEDMAKLGYTPVIAPAILTLPASKVERLRLGDTSEAGIEKILSEVKTTIASANTTNPDYNVYVKAVVLTLNTESYDHEGKLVSQEELKDPAGKIHIPMLSYTYQIYFGGHLPKGF